MAGGLLGGVVRVALGNAAALEGRRSVLALGWGLAFIWLRMKKKRFNRQERQVREVLGLGKDGNHNGSTADMEEPEFLNLVSSKYTERRLVAGFLSECKHSAIRDPESTEPVR